MTRGFAAVATVIVALSAATGGCAGGDAASSNATAQLSRTLAPGASEIYEQVGLDPREARCVATSGVDGDLTVTPGATYGDPIGVEADGVRVEIPPTLRTNAEVERLLQSAFAADCAPASTLDRLASVEGAAADRVAITDHLPSRLDARRAGGATDPEIACLDAGFRAAPARLSSVAAAPAIVELACVGPERRDEWWRAALDAAFAAAGAGPAERACLVASERDRLALAAVLDDGALDAGGPEAGGAEVPETAECVDPERLGELAVEMAAAEVSVEVLLGE